MHLKNSYVIMFNKQTFNNSYAIMFNKHAFKKLTCYNV